VNRTLANIYDTVLHVTTALHKRFSVNGQKNQHRAL